MDPIAAVKIQREYERLGRGTRAERELRAVLYKSFQKILLLESRSVILSFRRYI